MLEQPLLYHFSLLHCAWEAVQEEAVLAGRGVEVVLYQLHHHLVAHLQRAEMGAWSGGISQFYTQSCCTHNQCPGCTRAFSWFQRQQPQRRALLEQGESCLFRPAHTGEALSAMGVNTKTRLMRHFTPGTLQPGQELAPAL